MTGPVPAAVEPQPVTNSGAPGAVAAQLALLTSASGWTFACSCSGAAR